MFSGNEIKQVQSGVSTIINPTGSIRKLETQLKFSDTFNNRVALADAYLATGATDRAIELYESSLTGAFTENEHVIYQLIIAHCIKQNYNAVLPLSKKIYNLPQFARSKAHIAYAIALEHTGNKAQAEKEYQAMKARFSNFEARYNYGLFLLRDQRPRDARTIFKTMIEEESQLSNRERKYNRQWISASKDELKKLNTMQTV